MAKKFLSDIELDAGLVDVSGNTGTSGQILSSTGSATSWVAQGDIVSGEADKAKSVVLRVKNSTLSAMTKGQVVCENTSISPPSGNLIEVKLADNNGTGTMPALGILSQDLDASGGANDEGDAIMFGKVSGIDTSAFNVGDEVFVDDTAGGLTATKPTGVKYIQKIGVVIRDHASNGTIEVFGAGRVNDVPTPLYIDHANQRVGIGRETPSVDLHIDNDSSLPELRLSYEPTGGYGGGGNIRIQGGYNDYVSGSIQWYNAQNRDAQLIYTAVTRSMHFYVNERGSSTNGYFRFYNGSTEVAEINPSGVYGNVFYDQGNTAYYLNPASTGTALNTPLGSARVKDLYIGNSSGQISNRVWFDNGSSNQPGLYFEGGQPKFIIYSSVSNIFHDTYHPNADTWTTARTITIGNTGKSVNGSANVSWSLAEIGAQAALTNPITGTGTTNYLSKFTGSTTLGNSLVYDNGTNVGIGTTSPSAKLHVSSGTANEDCVVIIESDTDNNDENSNPRLELKQDGGAVIGRLGFRDNTNSLELINQHAESLYLGTSNSIDLTILSDGKVGIGTTSPNQKLTIKGTDQYVAAEQTTYAWGGTNTIGVRMGTDATAGLLDFRRWVGSATTHGTALITQVNSDGGYGLDFRVDTKTSNTIATTSRMFLSQSGEVGIGTTSPGQKLHVIGNVAADIFYDRNNTGYFFNGDASKDNVDLTSGGNYAINVLGTISGGHRKHGNLETLEMQWSVGGGTDLNWKKLCDVVINDANYAGWGAEIEITNFSGNFGNATYNGGELFKGALSIYHWGGTGYQPETAHANIPYEMRSHVRWYKINETGQNRYQLQVKSPGNYQQLYVKVKPGIGNQVADIITYANDTNGNTSGGTAYTSVQSSNFNHEFAGGIWTNDGRAIGWKNAYGSPYLQNYYGSITTSTSVYIGGPSGNGQDLYCDDLRSNKVYDRAATNYYFEGGNTGDSIRVAGDVVAYYSSDKRLKDNIKPIENALDKVNAISGVTFEWNEKSHKTTGRKDVGVVAQEVEEVFPEIVETRTNGFKAVDYQKLTAVLIESVKELTAKVEALEAKQCNCK